jgi:hypothetical protein
MQSKKRQLMLASGAAAISTLLPTGQVFAQSAQRKPTVVAAYFGGWCSPMDPTQESTHGPDPWADNATHRMGTFSGRHPYALLAADRGNQAQQHYMDEEIQLAVQYGVDVFAINWYRNDFLNYAVENFKKSKNNDQMKFFLQWSNNSNLSVNNAGLHRQYFFEGIRRAAQHMTHESYWKIGGKPVFAIYAVDQIDRIIFDTKKITKYDAVNTATACHDEFLRDCHNIVANVLAGDSTGGISGTTNDAKVLQPAGTFSPAMHLVIATYDIGSWGRCNNLQGMYLYAIRSKEDQNHQFSLTVNYDEMMTAAKDRQTLYVNSMRGYRSAKQTWWPTVMTGFDDSPWQKTDSAAQHCNATAAQFATHCSEMYDLCTKNDPVQNSVTGGIVFVYAWNEYGEGGWLAPSPDIGTSRLETVRDVLKKPYV